MKKKPKLTFDDIVTDIFEPVFSDLDDLVERIKQGTITLGQIDIALKQFETNPDELVKELRLVSEDGNDGWIEKRVHQIKQYYQLNTYRRGAKILMDIRDDFSLTGNFDTLAVLVDAVSIKPFD